MTPSQQLYDRLAPYYDWMSRALLAPFGGDARFRRRVVEAWGVREGARVLELGCGTGLMTQHLLARGARVTAVDNAAPMLARAKRRCPAATFALADVLAFETAERFDFAVLSYILHELETDARVRLLEVARGAIAAHGYVAIVDFDAGAREPVRTLLDGWLRVAEPPTAREWAQRGLSHDLPAAGLEAIVTERIGFGTARVILARARDRAR